MHEYYASKTSQQHFRYVDTPLVEAIRNGYLIEIQEPTVIANPGVLVGLNSLMDRCNSVFLPNGETVQRHPDMVIVVTTNNDYAGCKPLNQSVISRMSVLIDLMEPDEETLVERVVGVTGCKEKRPFRQWHGSSTPSRNIVGKPDHRWMLRCPGTDFLGAVLYGLR